MREPLRLTLAESSQVVTLGLSGGALKRLEGFPQHALFEIADRVILHSMRWKWRRICEITRRQQTLCLQSLQAQQQVIARKGRIGLVRGISVTGGPQRQQLPHLLAAIL